MDADKGDDIAFLANTPAQAETQLHILERVAGDIGLHVNADKTKYMCFNQSGDISTLNDSSLKLAHKFTFLGSIVLFMENDINTRLAKACTAIGKLLLVWKWDLSDEIKRIFFQTVVVSIMLYRCTPGHGDTSSNTGRDWLHFTLDSYPWESYESNYSPTSYR